MQKMNLNCFGIATIILITVDFADVVLVAVVSVVAVSVVLIVAVATAAVFFFFKLRKSLIGYSSEIISFQC